MDKNEVSLIITLIIAFAMGLFICGCGTISLPKNMGYYNGTYYVDCDNPYTREESDTCNKINSFNKNYK